MKCEVTKLPPLFRSCVPGENKVWIQFHGKRSNDGEEKVGKRVEAASSDETEGEREWVNRG